jgi:hypothetical protein
MAVPATDLVAAVRVLRDEVLETVEHGDREPPGAEVLDAVLRALGSGGASTPGLDLGLRDAVERRLAWGDDPATILADAEAVFDRLLVAAERALRDPADQLVVAESATLVAVTVARAVALAAVARASRDRTERLREELAQRQLQEVLDKQRATIEHLEAELRAGRSFD